MWGRVVAHTGCYSRLLGAGAHPPTLTTPHPTPAADFLSRLAHRSPLLAVTSSELDPWVGLAVWAPPIELVLSSSSRSTPRILCCSCSALQGERTCWSREVCSAPCLLKVWLTFLGFLDRSRLLRPYI